MHYKQFYCGDSSSGSESLPDAEEFEESDETVDGESNG